MFFNNRKGCGYRYLSSNKRNVKNLNQNLKICEKAFDNFNWKTDEDIADIYLKPFPVQLFICPNGKEVCIGWEVCLEQHHFCQILLNHFTSLGSRGLLENSTSFTGTSAGQHIFFNVVFDSWYSSFVYYFYLFTLTDTYHAWDFWVLNDLLEC